MRAVSGVVPLIVCAGAACGAQQLPPLRPIGAIAAESKMPLGRVAAVRALPNGNLIVQDNFSRRILLLDSALAYVRVIFDSAGPLDSSYPRGGGSLIKYRGD